MLQKIAYEKVLIGWSTGAIVLTPSMEIVDKFTPEMNIVNLDNLGGLSFTNTHILPHYSKFKKRFEDLEDVCKEYEQEHNCSIVNDENGSLTKVTAKDLLPFAWQSIVC